MSETEAMALSGVTYLGCGISIICILLTLLCMVVFRYSYCKDSFSEYLTGNISVHGRETLNKGVLLYIHFNLFLALLLALIIFVFGIETATHIKVSLLFNTIMELHLSLSFAHSGYVSQWLHCFTTCFSVSSVGCWLREYCCMCW